MTIQALKRRFDELLVQLDGVEETKIVDPHSGRAQVDAGLLLGWRVKARNLLVQACGAGSEHYKEFQHVENNPGISNHYFMLRLRPVFLAAKEDYEGGYLRSTRSLVHAEVFDDELEQATELLSAGYKVAAAVVAGAVLETTLRTLCGDNRVPVRTPDGKPVALDKMNADLAKASLYDKLVQKRVTMLADIRNKAAHGETAGFNDDDAKSMIAEVERFVSDYPTA
jgi:hypothetical protein